MDALGLTGSIEVVSSHFWALLPLGAFAVVLVLSGLVRQEWRRVGHARRITDCYGKQPNDFPITRYRKRPWL